MARLPIANPRYATSYGTLVTDFTAGDVDNSAGSRTLPLDDESTVGGSHDDPTHFLSGTGACHYQVASGGLCETRFNQALDLSQVKSVHVWIYRESVTDEATATADDLRVEFKAFNTAYNGQTNGYSWTDIAGDRVGKRNTPEGWVLYNFDIEDANNVGTPTGLDSIDWWLLKVSLPGAATAVECWIDSVYLDMHSRTKCMFIFDDAHGSVVDVAKPILDTAGFEASAAITKDNIGVANYMTVANLGTLKNAGWTLMNHSADGDNLSTLTEAELMANINECKTYLDGLGHSEYSDCVVYPSNMWTKDMITLMESNGYRFARGSTADNSRTIPFCGHPDSKDTWSFNKLAFPSNTVLGQTTFDSGAGSGAAIIAAIDDAIKYGTTCILTGHVIQAAGSSGDTEIDIADFQTIVDYITDRVNAGLIDVVSVGDFLDQIDSGGTRFA